MGAGRPRPRRRDRYRHNPRERRGSAPPRWAGAGRRAERRPAERRPRRAIASAIELAGPATRRRTGKGHETGQDVGGDQPFDDRETCVAVGGRPVIPVSLRRGSPSRAWRASGIDPQPSFAARCDRSRAAGPGGLYVALLVSASWDDFVVRRPRPRHGSLTHGRSRAAPASLSRTRARTRRLARLVISRC